MGFLSGVNSHIIAQEAYYLDAEILYWFAIELWWNIQTSYLRPPLDLSLRELILPDVAYLHKELWCVVKPGKDHQHSNS